MDRRRRRETIVGRGEPDFRIMSTKRFGSALRDGRCWVCGKVIHGTGRSFTLGPMCAVNRTSAEPPSHRECAEWSARNCPFLTRPHARRRDAGLPEGTEEPGGVMLRRNPGVALVWTTLEFSVIRPPGGGMLFRFGDPIHLSWWAEGRPATRAEVVASIESGLPSLMELAEQDGEEAVAELGHALERALRLAPAS